MLKKDGLFSEAEEVKNKVAYINALLDFMKKQSGDNGAVRSAVVEYFSQKNVSQQSLAEKYNVSQSAIARIARRLSELDVKVRHAAKLRELVKDYDDFVV